MSKINLIFKNQYDIITVLKGIAMTIKKYIKIFMITILFVTSINTANAGVVKKAIVGVILQRTVAFLITGQGKRATISFLKTAMKTPGVKPAIISVLSYVAVTMPLMGKDGNSVAKRARGLFVDLELNSPEVVYTVNTTTDMMTANYVYITDVILKDIEGDLRYTCFNKKELTTPKSPNAPIFQPYYLSNGLNPATKKLEEWDYASYSALVARAPKNDDLEHDHIPSVAAILKYVEKRDKLINLKRELGVGSYIKQNATAVEVKKSYHREGRTFGSPKSKEFDQLPLFENIFMANNWGLIKDELVSTIDAKDLKLATLKDFAYYGLKVKLDDPKVIKAMRDIYIRNYRLCLYD